MSKTKTTALSVEQKNQLAAINAFFNNIDFSGMNAAIKRLADHPVLDESEKTSAMEIIDDWNKNVIERLELERQDLMILSNAFRSHDITLPDLLANGRWEEELHMMADFAGAHDMLADMEAAIKDYAVAEHAYYENRCPDTYLDMTIEEKVMAENDFRLQNMRLEDNLKKIGNKIARLNDEIKKTILDNQQMNEILTSVFRKMAAISRLKLTCSEKASLAKINVTISDKNVREALTDLISFKI